MRKISQRTARRALKRVAELEALRKTERAAWVSEYPNGIHLAEWEPSDWLFHSIKTARRLGFPVVVTHKTGGKIDFYVVKEGA